MVAMMVIMAVSAFADGKGGTSCTNSTEINEENALPILNGAQRWCGVTG
jgi:hypothetical protein